MTIKQMAAEHGVSYGAVRGRLVRGYSLEEALDPNYRRKKTGFKPKMHTAFGKTQTLTEWARETGLGYSRLQHRIKSGMTLEEAIRIGEKRPKPDALHVEYKGEMITVGELSRRTGKKYSLLYYRITRMGLTAEQAVDMPVVHGGWREGAGRKALYANGCRYHDNCDTCPFDDCRM